MLVDVQMFAQCLDVCAFAQCGDAAVGFLFDIWIFGSVFIGSVSVCVCRFPVFFLGFGYRRFAFCGFAFVCCSPGGGFSLAGQLQTVADCFRHVLNWFLLNLRFLFSFVEKLVCGPSCNLPSEWLDQ